MKNGRILAELEPQWLFVYQPELTFMPSLPHDLNTSEYLEEFWYLLTRTPTSLIWIGTPPLGNTQGCMDLNEALIKVSKHSPWGGLQFFTEQQSTPSTDAPGTVYS